MKTSGLIQNLSINSLRSGLDSGGSRIGQNSPASQSTPASPVSSIPLVGGSTPNLEKIKTNLPSADQLKVKNEKIENLESKLDPPKVPQPPGIENREVIQNITTLQNRIQRALLGVENLPVGNADPQGGSKITLLTPKPFDPPDLSIKENGQNLKSLGIERKVAANTYQKQNGGLTEPTASPSISGENLSSTLPENLKNRETISKEGNSFEARIDNFDLPNLFNSLQEKIGVTKVGGSLDIQA